MRSRGTACREWTACFSSDALQTEDDRKKWINKILYRSRQRGFLELDLLVGLWAEQHVPQMDMNMLQQFSLILEQENPDLFKWLTGQQPPPQELQHNPAYVALSQHVQQQLAENAPSAAQAAAGQEWVRGWDDAWSQEQAAAAAPALAAALFMCAADAAAG
eukprot:gene3786-biopygen5487